MEKETERKDEPMSAAAGISEVHTEIHSGPNQEPSKGVGMSGKFDDEVGSTEDGDEHEGIAGRVRDAMHEASDRARRMGAEARRHASDARGRSSGMVSIAGVTTAVQQFPLVALGLAFGAGYALAGRGPKKGVKGALRRQVRTALVSGLTAALTQQAQGWLGDRMEHGADS